MGNKDKFMLIGAFVAILFIGFIVISNYPNKGKELTVGSYYTSDETTTIGKREGSSYGSLTGSSRKECPGLDNNSPEGHTVITTGVAAYVNAYGFSYLPVTQETAKLPVKALTKNNLSSSGINNATGSAGSGTIDNMFKNGVEYPIGNGTYYEIIAPFAFTYTNYNSEVDSINESRLEIVNSSGTCKMTVTHVANWFCAGPYGTVTDYSNQDEPYSWEEHNYHHLTKVGFGSNFVTGGSAGELIGYGDAGTEFKFYGMKNGTWTEMSLYELLKSSVQ